jgi:hypothetical protein
LKSVNTTVAQAMSKTVISNDLRFLAQGLSAVAARMEPNAAAAKLTQASSKATNTFESQFLAQGLSAVAIRMEPNAAAATLTQAMSETNDPNVLGSLAQGLSGVLRSNAPGREVGLAGTVVSPNGLAPVPTAPAQLTPALEPLPSPLPAQMLVDLLKHPLCVGEARGVVLEELAQRYGRPFTDQWEFVRFAEEHQLGLDLLSLPPR